MGEDWEVIVSYFMTLNDLKVYVEEHRGISRHRMQFRLKGKEFDWESYKDVDDMLKLETFEPLPVSVSEVENEAVEGVEESATNGTTTVNNTANNNNRPHYDVSDDEEEEEEVEVFQDCSDVVVTPL
eukprot:gene33370-41181_t